MKLLSRACLVCLAFLAPLGYAAAPDPSLLGCWRATKIVLHAQDGTKTEDTSGRCTLHFEDSGFESTCGTAAGTSRTTYQYQIARPNVYAATMTGSTFRTSLVGSTREYEYHVDGDRLFTVAALPATSPAAPAVTPRVESEAVRTPCN